MELKIKELAKEIRFKAKPYTFKNERFKLLNVYIDMDLNLSEKEEFELFSELELITTN